MEMHGGILVNATDIDPAFWCEHDDGRFSIRLSRELDGVSLSLTGTCNELGDMVHALAAVVTARRQFEQERDMGMIVKATETYGTVAE